MTKAKRENIAIILVIILVLGYVFYKCYSVTHIELETETAALTTVYETVDAKALVIRQEHTLSKDKVGVTVPCLADGDKINAGGNVAMRFSNADDAAKYSQYSKLKAQIEYYENLESQTVGQASSVESINDEIDLDVDEYIRALNSGSASDISQTSSAVNDCLLRRQMIIGEKVDLASIVGGLRNQLASYSVAPNNYITTKESGVFSSYTDGYENVFDYSKIETITTEDINSALDKIQSEQIQTDNLGKLITAYDWYFAVSVPKDQAKNLKEGSKYDVVLKDSEDEVISVTVKYNNPTDSNDDTVAVVLECDEMTAQLAALRAENIEIRFKSYEGIKAPSSALHIKDGKKGVYVLISSQVKFRQADILYSNNDYVLLSYDASASNGIRIYDKIITQGKDLEDGKVYT